MRYKSRCILVAAGVVAMGSGGAQASSSAQTSLAAGTSTPAIAQTAEAAAKVPSTGVIDTVTVTTDATGNYFKPNTLTVHRGAVIRFVLVAGVHNVDFLADSNSSKSGLPAPSAFLTLPGQSVDVPVTFAPGTYYFQCDPHAPLGMHGHVIVE